MSEELKVGDEIEFVASRYHDELKRFVTAVGEENILYKIMRPGGGECAVLKTDVRRVEPFFEKGKTYRLSGGVFYTILTVQEVGGRKFAWATRETAKGACPITLDEDDFFSLTPAP